MVKILSVFNNKGGVGKSTICWNLADTLGRQGKRVLLIDFDPQCNLSIAMLGENTFTKILPQENLPYGKTARSFLQRFLQNTGGEEVFLHNGVHTHSNVDLIAGDFWLNIYADSLNVGADLLTGTGLARYVAIRKMVEAAEKKRELQYDYAIIDLPPSFGSLVRAAFYSSDFYVVPCTSDSFSVYCVGLIGQMVPAFIKDWESGLGRFKNANPHYSGFDMLGKPVFAGWIFNGFDTARRRRNQEEIAQGVLKEKELIQADRTMHSHISEAIKKDLVRSLENSIKAYCPVAESLLPPYQLGGIEDANALIQNSLLLSVPLGQLEHHEQVTDIQDKRKWAHNQKEQIRLLQTSFEKVAASLNTACLNENLLPL